MLFLVVSIAKSVSVERLTAGVRSVNPALTVNEIVDSRIKTCEGGSAAPSVAARNPDPVGKAISTS
jgi:hypothetical protein